MKRILISIIITAILLCNTIAVSYAESRLDMVIKDTADYLFNTVKAPVVSSIGGEWAIIGLSRSGADVSSEYFENYYNNVKKYVEDKNGALHNRKYTEYSRVALALTAIGKNPLDVAGYNLLMPLGDFEKTIWQGINGPVWALIALDSNNYDIPENTHATVQATREMYVSYILDTQNADGGWSLSKSFTVSDIDVTAMVLQALSKYKDSEEVKTATERGFHMLSIRQNENGGFGSSCESSAQVLTAMCENGVAYNSPPFIKNSKTVLDDILSYYTGEGFKHTQTGKVNQMATEQAFYSLVALKRYNQGKPGLYTMTDATKALAFPVKKSIIIEKSYGLLTRKYMKREEIAKMIFNLFEGVENN